MHKNILLYIIGMAITFSACKKDDNELFDKPADQRLSEKLSEYQQALTQAPGWKVFVYPQGLLAYGVEVGGMSYYMKFIDSNRVSMISDFSADMAAAPNESGFRLKAVQRPSLYFDTYSYIHVPCDPDPTVSFSPVANLGGGYGWGSDFEFAFADEGPGDTIRLKGNANNSDAIMIKLTAEETNDAFSGGLSDIIDATSTYVENNSSLYLEGADDLKIGMTFDFYLTMMTLFYLDAGNGLVSVSAAFSHTATGLRLKEPVNIGGFTFQELFWDASKSLYYIMNGGNRVELKNSSTPLFPLHLIIGNFYSTITVPTTALPGQSSLFTTKYAEIKTALINGPFTLTLDIMEFVFNAQTKTMNLDVSILQNGQRFLARYAYSYETDNAGNFEFTRTGQNGNAASIEDDMRGILDYLESDHFKLDYFQNGSSFLGQFTSRERPNFFFTGTLK